VLVGGQAILELGDDGFIPATVAWLVGDQVGLSFRSKFDMAQLARSTPEVAPPKWVAPDYLRPAGSKVARSGAVMVVVFCDGGERYLSERFWENPPEGASVCGTN
jgi:hypothetical protein